MRVRRALGAGQVLAVRPEHGRRLDSMVRGTVGVRTKVVGAMDVDCMHRFGDLARQVALGQAKAMGSAEWGDLLRTARGVAVGDLPACTPWDTGGAAVLERHRGTRTVYALEDGEEVEGGADGWLLREDVGEDGFLVGWQACMEDWLATWTLDAEGWVVDREGVRVLGNGLRALPVCLRMYGRCREQLPVGVPVYEGPLGLKREETHLNLAEAARCWHDLARFQAQYGITRAFTLDGSLQEVSCVTATGAESKFWVASRAVVDQDGLARGGRLQEAAGGYG